jgi:PhzF family phenazine biosynthesis protein
MPDLIFHVDALTALPFRGHPVSVCLLEKPRERPWMRDVSLELNTSETAFLLARGPNRFDLRTMAGGSEVEIATSATLAAAHALFTRSIANASRPIAFFTHGGQIPATRMSDHATSDQPLEKGMLEINFPALSLEELSNVPEDILQGVDPATEYVGRRGDDYVVHVSTEEQLRAVRPDFRFLRSMGMRGLIVTSVANVTTSHDFVARTFHIPTPQEDPTASYANCLLAPFWFLRLGKRALTCIIESARLPRARNSAASRLFVDGDRVKLIGGAVTVFEGELKI